MHRFNTHRHTHTDTSQRCDHNQCGADWQGIVRLRGRVSDLQIIKEYGKVCVELEFCERQDIIITYRYLYSLLKIYGTVLEYHTVLYFCRDLLLVTS